MELIKPKIPYLILSVILSIILLSHFSCLPDTPAIVIMLAFLIYWLFEEQKIYEIANDPHKVIKI